MGVGVAESVDKQQYMVQCAVAYGVAPRSRCTYKTWPNAGQRDVRLGLYVFDMIYDYSFIVEQG